MIETEGSHEERYLQLDGLKKMALILLKIMAAKYNSTVTMQVGAFYTFVDQNSTI